MYNHSKNPANEKYIGDALLQKTYTVDFLSKHRVKNTGEVPQYYVEDHHEAIIPKNIFYAVQEEMLRRQSGKRGKNGVKRSYSSNNCFSNIVVCGNCGDIFRRVHWNNRGKKSIVWRCVSRLENRGTKCTARTLPEDDLILTTMTSFKKMLTDKKEFLNRLMLAIEEGIKAKWSLPVRYRGRAGSASTSTYRPHFLKRRVQRFGRKDLRPKR